MSIKYKTALWACAAACAAVMAFFWISGAPRTQSQTRESVIQAPPTRSVSFDHLAFTKWDSLTAAAEIETRTKKPFTILIYMNGSDLESESGMATADLAEMIESGFDSANLHLVLFTGGTSRWQNDVIPANGCAVWEIAGGKLAKLNQLELLNMGDPGTLAGFINYAYEKFPADKYGLIMWDHGGGSIAGYGQDENFDNTNLTLLDMNYAFAKSAAAKKKLEFLGFDSCLMGTVEMAVVASDYARFLVASEDLEPMDGWNYNFLGALSNRPEISGSAVGKLITDTFMDFYGTQTDENLTMSVIDLKNVGLLLSAMGNLMARCEETITEIPSFRLLARKRSGTKTFGEGSPRDNQCDMVDLGDMAEKLGDLFPDESRVLLQTLKQAVLYNRHNSDVDLSGLSAYYIYGGKAIASYALGTYADLQMSGTYTEYLRNFCAMLNNTSRARQSRSGGGSAADIITRELTAWTQLASDSNLYQMTGIQDFNQAQSNTDDTPPAVSVTGDNMKWPQINGIPMCLYRISGADNKRVYAAPAVINGRECDIIVVISDRHPTGKILGARQNDGMVIQKGYDRIEKGDKIAVSYAVRDFSAGENMGWANGSAFTAGDEIRLEWAATPPGDYTSVLTTDIYGRQTYEPLQPVTSPLSEQKWAE